MALAHPRGSDGLPTRRRWLARTVVVTRPCTHAPAAAACSLGMVFWVIRKYDDL